MNTDTTEERYTALYEGEVYLTDLTLEEAAHEILTHDSCEYQLRRNEEGYYDLWSRQQVANIGWSQTWYASCEEKKEDAMKDIFQKVVSNLKRRGHLEIMTSKEYDEYCKSIAEDEEYDDNDD